MGYLSILTPRQHDSHPGATTGMTCARLLHQSWHLTS